MTNNITPLILLKLDQILEAVIYPEIPQWLRHREHNSFVTPFVNHIRELAASELNNDTQFGVLNRHIKGLSKGYEAITAHRTPKESLEHGFHLANYLHGMAAGLSYNLDKNNYFKSGIGKGYLDLLSHKGKTTMNDSISASRAMLAGQADITGIMKFANEPHNWERVPMVKDTDPKHFA